MLVMSINTVLEYLHLFIRFKIFAVLYILYGIGYKHLTLLID